MTDGTEGDGGTRPADPFRVEFVPGVTPDKWLRVWGQRLPDSPLEAAPVDDAEALTHVRDGTSSMVLLRLPVDRDGLHVIPLYEEVPVVVVAKEHVVAAFDEVDVTDLGEEVLMQDPALVPEWAAVATSEARDRSAAMPPMTTKQAVSVVATGSGIVVVPMSVARLHHRKDVVHRPVTGVAPSRVGLAWRVDDDDPRIEDFIGIVRGRTERSTRGGTSEPASSQVADETARQPGRAKSSTTPARSGDRSRGAAGRRAQQPGRKGAARGGGPRRKGRR
ncbi:MULTISPECIES: LysR substrate-binding domain-containing protein [unclassified Terrabacter]|uniref:LysR substrate-binding domain-containing protein n=1 Tax=unclassified Terrabacter TaxID=2630222 RepID=UPI0006F911A6|nr:MULTISPECIES: LysR substrate-binding domain-containing protein [unclassified Terrabacter]KRB45495.1 LysR family transcriptional regulator [Terrabacter sp. Root181]KRF41345.1 LysR family transcriptional regulator [Terrabacter sp. Soil810]